MKLFQFPMLAGALILAGAAQSTCADEASQVVFVPSIGYQQKTLNFDQTYTAGRETGRSAKFEVDLPTANFSLTTSYSKFFVTLKYEKSLSDVGVEADEVPTTGAPRLYYLNVPDEKTDVSREDMSLTIGMNVWRSLNIFVGQMKGETELTPSVGCTYQRPVNFVAPFRRCGQVGTQVNLAFDHHWDSLPVYRQNYTEEGPYIGASYSWQIADIGSLSLSAAHAEMDGEYKDNYIDVDTTKEDWFSYKGDSKGNSYGLTWTAPLGDQSNYFIDVRRQEYSMKGKDETNFPGEEVETDETMTGFTAGVQVYF